VILTKEQILQAKEAEEFANRYTPLVELLSAEDLAVVNAICVTAGAEQESILESLIKFVSASFSLVRCFDLTDCC
jgi:hypothetical protein